MGAVLQGQRIERVTVYPSDFGLEQMAAEARLGPQSVFASRAKPAENGKGQPGADAEADDEASDDDLPDGTAARQAANPALQTCDTWTLWIYC